MPDGVGFWGGIRYCVIGENDLGRMFLEGVGGTRI